MDDQTTTDNTTATSVFNPFARSAEGERAVGATQAASRENTEVMAMIMSAKRFPRDVVRAADRIQNAFARATLAEQSQYQFARGGTDISGPSIRSAEAMSQQWGNMSNGWRELNRYKGPDGVGVSECEAFSIDFESNTRESIQFIVRHWRDTKKGGYALSDERDIYELLANQSQRRKRAAILAQIPGDVTEMAMEQASITLAAKADTSPEGIAKLEKTFAEFGITRVHIEARIQRRMEAIQPAQIVGLKRIYASLRDAMSNPADWFDIEPEAVVSDRLEAVRAAAKQKRAGKGSKEQKQAAAAPTGDDAAATAAPAPATPTPQAAASTDKGEQAAAEGGGLFAAAPDDTRYAEFAERITKAKDEQRATETLDEARSVLSAEAHADLAKVWRAKWVPR
jgi:hypothetical protein